MYKVSILIPVYNVEKYLSKCLESILLQTYKNIEIIIINDGTTDSSLDIAELYASKYDLLLDPLARDLAEKYNNQVTKEFRIKYSIGDDTSGFSSPKRGFTISSSKLFVTK